MNFMHAITACRHNGERLLNEAELLRFESPPSTQFFLSVIAQEEFAKGFILYLASTGAIPWDNHALRVTRDHKCKQLICVVLDYLCPDFDLFIERMNARLFQGVSSELPRKVADAMNLLRHEKLVDGSQIIGAGLKTPTGMMNR